jgi:hypothetical protein
MLVSIIKLYDLLKTKIGEKEAEAFVEILDKGVEEKFEEKKNILATKEDINNLKQDINNLRVSTKEEIISVRSELLRTVYLTSLGQVIAIIASVISIILALKK